MVSVERCSERVMIVKLIIDNGLLDVLTVYAPHTGKSEEEKKFWNELFDLVSCIPPVSYTHLTLPTNREV